MSRIGSADHTATMFVLPRLGIQPDKEMNIVQVGLGAGALRRAGKRLGAGRAIDPAGNGESQGAWLPGAQQLCRHRYPLSAERRVHDARRSSTSGPEILRRFAIGVLRRQPLHSHQFRRHPAHHAQVSYKATTSAIREAYTEVVLKATPKIPYPSKPGIQTLIDFLATTAPEAAKTKPDDFIDTKFVKELGRSTDCMRDCINSNDASSDGQGRSASGVNPEPETLAPETLTDPYKRSGGTMFAKIRHIAMYTHNHAAVDKFYQSALRHEAHDQQHPRRIRQAEHQSRPHQRRRHRSGNLVALCRHAIGHGSLSF